MLRHEMMTILKTTSCCNVLSLFVTTAKSHHLIPSRVQLIVYNKRTTSDWCYSLVSFVTTYDSAQPCITLEQEAWAICVHSMCTVTVFLGAFAKFRKATISVVVCISVCPPATTRRPVNKFSWNLISEYFSKICRENSSFVNVWQGTLHEDLRTFVISCWIILRMRNVSFRICRENQNTVYIQ
jgi:hypothetical protein